MFAWNLWSACFCCVFLSFLLQNFCFGLIGYLFYGPSTHFRSFWAQSVTLTTLFLGKPPNAHSFASNWQLLFLNQQKRKNGRKNFFMTKSPRKNVPDSGPLACQADTLPIELPRLAAEFLYLMQTVTECRPWSESTVCNNWFEFTLFARSVSWAAMQ